MSQVRNAIAPYLTEDFLKALSMLFPNQCPNLKDEDRVVWYKAGQYSVVDTLQSILQENSENVLQYNITN
jgi:hypothetical protein